MRLHDVRVGEDYALAPIHFPDRATVLEVGLPWSSIPNRSEKSHGVRVRYCRCPETSVVHFRSLLMPWSTWEEQEQRHEQAEKEVNHWAIHLWRRQCAAVERIIAAAPELELGQRSWFGAPIPLEPISLSADQLDILATLLESSRKATK